MTAAGWLRTGDRRVWAAEAPGGRVLTVTQLGRTSWVPALIGPERQDAGRATPCKTRLEAPAVRSTTT